MRLLVVALKYLPRNLRGHRFRSILCALGIGWGTLVMALLMAFSTGMRIKMREDFAGIGSNIIFVWAGNTSKPWAGLLKDRPIVFREDDMEALRSLVPGLQAALPIYSSRVTASTGEKTTDGDVQGVEPALMAVRDLEVAPGGRRLSEEDLLERRQVAVVGPAFAKALFTGPACGRTFRLWGYDFTVVGCLKSKSGKDDDDDRSMDSDRVFLPSSTFRALTGRLTFNNFLIKPEDSSANEPVLRGVRETLSARMKFDPEDKEALEFWDVTETTRTVDSFMAILLLFSAISGLMTLVAGGVGVSNIMSVAVEERTREIGIQMALGARRIWILGQYLAETLAIIAVGGSLGILAAWGLCWGLPKMGVSTDMGVPTFTPPLALATMGALGAVGLFAGLGPARDAAAKDPIVAMKA
jgi:putative ABC transport system permease protein